MLVPQALQEVVLQALYIQILPVIQQSLVIERNSQQFNDRS